MGFFRSLISCFLLLVAGHAAYAAAPDHYRACESLKHCADILERHGPDQFDYDVLARDISRFGPKGTDRLIKMVGSNKEDAAQNAIDMLSALHPNLSPRQADHLISAWPKDRPRGGLLSLIQNAQTPLANAEFRAGLMSGDSSAVQIAFDALARQNTDDAIRALQGAVFALENHQIDAALALSDLIVSLDKKEQGDRFKKYAFGLAQDEKIRPIANAVGIDAAIKTSASENMLGRLSNSLVAMAAFEKLVSQGLDGHISYWELLPEFSRNNPGPWTDLGLRLYNQNPALGNLPILQSASRLDAQGFQKILNRFLDIDEPLNSLANVIGFAASHDFVKYKARISQIVQSHPSPDIRALGAIIENPNFEFNQRLPLLNGNSGALKEPIRVERQRATKCAIESFNFRERIVEVPYFDWRKLNKRFSFLNSKYISSAWPRLNGWLVGFERGEWSGALVFVSHDMNEQTWLVKNQGIQAIIPFSAPAGQFYADRYWVISEVNSYFGDRQIYQLVFVNGKSDIVFVTEVSASAGEYGRAPDNSLLIGYGDAPSAHPPLRISPDGRLSRVCE